MLLSRSLAVVLSASLQLARAVNIYLSPSPSSLRSTLSPEEASAALSRHLGLDAFEPLWGASDLTHSEEAFVGQGFKNALVVTVEEKDLPGTIITTHRLCSKIDLTGIHSYSTFVTQARVLSEYTILKSHRFTFLCHLHISPPCR